MAPEAAGHRPRRVGNCYIIAERTKIVGPVVMTEFSDVSRHFVEAVGVGFSGPYRMIA